MNKYQKRTFHKKRFLYLFGNVLFAKIEKIKEQKKVAFLSFILRNKMYLNVQL